ncbi:hypothetical protein OBBRIDRAFT_815682 [Obba rivulosa]|uniref:CxC1-like cysteine cluster associated with KDZ transposases domain-containing protein n=1 Tax=Obba rivulosa TaxID=1052685 RepID=A0A8E2AL56_9APHY|nr:hypothetical protein OBBRIDRAFT_815682 [Obba rivulosa]
MPKTKALRGASRSVNLALVKRIAPGTPSSGTPTQSRLSTQVLNQTEIARRREEAQRSVLDSITVDVIDIYTLDSSAYISRSADSRSAAEDMALRGYLATTPVSPTLAISFKTLELFRRLRLRKPSFSVEAFAKVICDFYAIPYRRVYRMSLSNAFDVYLSIHRIIDGRMSELLGRNTPDWRVLNACPACTYELDDETPLRFSRMICIDGNNSLKRMAKVGSRDVGDTRIFSQSDYYLPDDFVDQFAHEVKARKQAAKVVLDDNEDSHDGIIEEDVEEEGDPTDLAPMASGNKSCTDNWKAAADDLKKKMWGVFEETGIFASACRHGFILWITDMIKSGELAKYPLAIVSKALEVFKSHGMLGYDIGCDFEQTICRSSLGPRWEQLRWRCCVNAFHGYSHNFRCQTRNHPNNITGMGLEDLETLERVFSSSNQLASVVRYASRYRRRVHIDMFFKQWDEDKYANIATMLYNNYVQACEIIRTESQAVAEVVASLGIKEEDLEKWHMEEAEYFATLGDEPPWDIHAMAYVDLLREYWQIESRHTDATSQFLLATPIDYQFILPTSALPRPVPAYGSDASRTRRLETERRRVAERRDQILRELLDMEVRMGIDHRWQRTSPEYIATTKYIASRDYHRALDNLQRLVVQRLFELHNLNLSQTGYRMRTHIAKSLQTRCKAIRNAVTMYNKAALSLDPPRPTIDWTKVSHFSFLEEFNLLRETRNDIRDKPWTRPLVREAMKKSRRIARAREELQRCNVEVRRLHTAIEDENGQLHAVLDVLQKERHPMHGAVADYAKHRIRVNKSLLSCIGQIYKLEGFTGGSSVPVGSDDTVESLDSTREEDDAEDLLDTEGDDEHGHIDGIVDYIAELPTRT